MKAPLILTLLVVLITGSFINAQDDFDGYILKGKTKNLANGTIIQLVDELTDAIVDTAEVNNQTFTFKGKLENPPSLKIIQVKGLDECKFLWMENKEITFDASKSDFKKAEITGSELQDFVQEHLFNQTDALDARIDENYRRVLEIQMDFVEKYPDNIQSALILSVYSFSPQFSTKRIMDMYDKLSYENKQHPYGQKALETIKLRESIEQKREGN